MWLCNIAVRAIQRHCAGGNGIRMPIRIRQQCPISHYKVLRMSRLIVSVVVILVVVVGGLFLLAGRATERPQTQVEKAVTLANLS